LTSRQQVQAGKRF